MTRLPRRTLALRRLAASALTHANVWLVIGSMTEMSAASKKVEWH